MIKLMSFGSILVFFNLDSDVKTLISVILTPDEIVYMS